MGPRENSLREAIHVKDEVGLMMNRSWVLVESKR